VGAMPAGVGTTQTAVNVHAGARTQLAEVVTAVMALATTLLLASLVG
jgi:MFS superfamily sulfate permease-like transporter